MKALLGETDNDPDDLTEDKDNRSDPA
jgi:hypothetical protein